MFVAIIFFILGNYIDFPSGFPLSLLPFHCYQSCYLKPIWFCQSSLSHKVSVTSHHLQISLSLTWGTKSFLVWLQSYLPKKASTSSIIVLYGFLDILYSSHIALFFFSNNYGLLRLLRLRFSFWIILPPQIPSPFLCFHWPILLHLWNFLRFPWSESTSSLVHSLYFTIYFYFGCRICVNVLTLV